MNDNAELIAKLRAIGLPRDTADSKLIAQCIHELVVAARDAAHWRRLYIEECGKGDVELENAQRDLRAAAASEAAMRAEIKSMKLFVAASERNVPGGVIPFNIVRAFADRVLSTPASALAERYEAAVKAMSLPRAAHELEHDTAADPRGAVLYFRTSEDRDRFLTASAAIDHPTPAKDDEA